jgi:hypothetical protein
MVMGYVMQCQRHDTSVLTDKQLYAFYKAEAVHADARFYLETQTMSPELTTAFLALFDATVTKTTPAHRKELARLKTWWRVEAEVRYQARRPLWTAAIEPEDDVTADLAEEEAA